MAEQPSQGGGPREVKIFVSSPGDVMPERQRLERVSERLNGRLGGAVRLSCVRWEERFYTADRTFQAQIAPSIACDLVVSIFWTRLGTALPAEFGDRLPDGRPYPSGTAYELLTALEASRQKSLPDVFVFRKTSPSATPTDNAQRQAFNRQLDALETFWEEWFLNREGQFRAAFNTFVNTDEFEAQVERLLRGWLAEKGLLRKEVRWRIEEKGSPFRGLLPFEESHADVFFGRSIEIERGKERLSDAAARGVPFLLILGASGTGKSSLARAGLIPRLLASGAVDGVDQWRVARVAPGIGEHDPVKALAVALLEGQACPELGDTPNATPEGLAGQLAHGGESAVGLVRWALDRFARSVGQREGFDRPVAVRLLLLVDQFESLFAPDIDADKRRAFVAALDGLVRSGLAWVIATMRSTDYALLQADPLLLKLKEQGATLDLGPPDGVAIAEAIEGPSDAAGLALERDTSTGHGLDELLRAEASGSDALPLLQFTLQNLFEAREVRDGVPTLTLAAYRALGGIEGAIAAEAERTASALPAEAQAQLPWLLRQLVGMRRQGELQAGTLRDMPLDEAELARRPGARALIEALAGARILVLDSSDGAGTRARLAHEAVLRSWQRARAVVSDNARFFRVRAELGDSFARWEREGRARVLLLPAGTPLSEAEELVASYGDELPANWREYVRTSRRQADRARHVAWAVAAGMAVLFLASAAGALLALRSEMRAATERDAALVAQSRHIATQARQLSQQGDVATALALSLEGLPAAFAKPERPWDALAEGALLEQTLHLRERRIFAGHKAQLPSVSMSPDGKRVLTASWDSTARLWDLATGNELAVLDAHGKPLTSAVFSPDGKWIATTAFDGLVGIWDAAGAKPLRALQGHTNIVTAAQFSPDSRRIVSISWDKTARVRDVATGELVFALEPHKREISAVAFSSDGTKLVTAEEGGALNLWSASTGERLPFRPKHAQTVAALAFSPDGKRLATASWDRTVRLWNLETGEETAVLRGHADSVVSLAFSPDGAFLASGAWDRTIRVWSAATGHELGALRGHAGYVQGLAFTPDGRHLVSASADSTARLWNVSHPPELRVLAGHDTLASSVAFSRDGTKVVSGAYSKVARLWDVASGKEIVVLRGHLNVVAAASFSPDGARVVTGSWDQTARLWDVLTGREVAKLDGHTAAVGAVAFSPDGKLVASGGWDSTARIWDAASGRELTVFRGHEKGFVYAVTFSPDGKLVASGGNDGVWRVWEAANGREVLKQDGSGHDSTIVAIAWDASGKRLLTGALDKTARLWDASTGKMMGVMRGHEHTVTSVAFSPDGTRLLSGSNDMSVRLWDEASERELALMRGHLAQVSGVAFSPDGKWLATAGNDGAVLLWPHLQGQALLDRACELMVRPLSGAQRRQYFLEPAPLQPRCGRTPIQ